MKAITLTQPWASLMVAKRTPQATHAVKWIETRSWQLRKTPLPLRVAIHAAQSIDAQTRRYITKPDLPRPSKFKQPYAQALSLGGLSFVNPWLPGAQERHGAIPRGAIVGCATLWKIEASELADAKIAELDPLCYALGLFTPGRFAWYFERPYQLATPIPCRGALSLWTVPEEHRATLEQHDPHYYETER